MSRNTIEKLPPDAAIPAHVKDAIGAVTRFHATHEAEATRLQRVVERLTRRAGRPAFIGLLTTLVLSWIALNVLTKVTGRAPIDPPPFFWMQGAVALAALYMTVFILATQRRENELAALRDQLTLELSILSEQKSAKIIGLLEEMRRDDPSIMNRRDDHADALAEPANADAVFNALKTSQSVPIVSED